VVPVLFGLIKLDEAGKAAARRGVVPSKKSKSDKKVEAHQNDVAAERKIMQSVVRTVQESIWVHCYLSCGHMITVHKQDLKESSPHSIECWACEEETKRKI
jgi:hypothetical protein